MNMLEAMNRVFALMAARYGKRWEFPASAATLWADWLELEGATPEQALKAADKWSGDSKWPPCYSEFLQAIPGNCRCGKNTCGECSMRAYRRNCARTGHGTLDYDADAPALPARMGNLLPGAIKQIPPRTVDTRPTVS